MNMIAHSRAMSAFCRQRAQFENEDASFWIEEAEEWENLIAQYSIRQSPSVPSQSCRSCVHFMQSNPTTLKSVATFPYGYEEDGQ
jgi:hypothetical protein